MDNSTPFRTFGTMLDCSRNAVPNSAPKRSKYFSCVRARNASVMRGSRISTVEEFWQS